MALTYVQIFGAADALNSILSFEHPADAMLSNFFRSRPKLGSADRRSISETVYAVLRRYQYLSALIAPTVTPRRLAIAALIKLRGHNLREIAEHLTDADKQFATELKGREIELDLAAKAELPAWLIERLALPEEELLVLGRSLQQAAPLDLRVNTFKAKREKVLEQLNGEGLGAAPTPFSPFGIRMKEKFALQKHPLFLDGSIEVQDEGSQLLTHLVGARRGEMVVDFCAGAGGKTLGLAAAMANTGRVYAFDVSEKRLNNLSPRLKRSGLSNIQPQLIASEKDMRIKRLHGKIDRVLVDAPCSGMGTLRRNPDLKFRQSPQSVAELNVKQSAILAAAAPLLKAGGRLIYATCSLLREENQAIVEAFLASHPQFTLQPIAEAWSRVEGLHTGDYLELQPHKHNTDGFFAAVLVRKAG